MALDNERTVAVLAILGICGVAFYRFIIWVTKPPSTADPWGKEVQEAVQRDDAVAICHRCLTPQEHFGWFCPECGAVVGQYCNCMPYLYLFSQGEVLRVGAMGRFRRSFLVSLGLVLFSLGVCASITFPWPRVAGGNVYPGIFILGAPIYWWLVVRNLGKGGDTQGPTSVEQPITKQPAGDTGPAAIQLQTGKEEEQRFKICVLCRKSIPAKAAMCPKCGWTQPPER